MSESHYAQSTIDVCHSFATLTAQSFLGEEDLKRRKSEAYIPFREVKIGLGFGFGFEFLMREQQLLLPTSTATSTASATVQ